jgi:hypothetical protein
MYKILGIAVLLILLVIILVMQYRKIEGFTSSGLTWQCLSETKDSGNNNTPVAINDIGEIFCMTQTGSTTNCDWSVATSDSTCTNKLTRQNAGSLKCTANQLDNSNHWCYRARQVLRVPKAPTITNVTAGNASIVVNFTAGANNKAPITNYQYQLTTGTTEQTWADVNPATTTSPITITGLTNGTTYSVRLRAKNAYDVSPASTGSFSATPIITAPSAPSITKLIPGNRLIKVEFTAGSNGGATITNYQYSINNGVDFYDFSPSATSSPLTITGLMNDTAYKVLIRAKNSAGNGASSNMLEATPTLKDLKCEVTPAAVFQMIGGTKTQVAKCEDSSVSNESGPLLQNIIDMLSSYSLSRDQSGNYVFDGRNNATSSDADKLNETKKLIQDLNETLKSDKIKDRLESSAESKKTTTAGEVSTTGIGSVSGASGACSLPATTCVSPIVSASDANTACLQQGSEMKQSCPDMSQYVRKDSIPCWNCNLDY